MNKTKTRGNAGLDGWTTEPDDLEAYFETVQASWIMWAKLWYWFRPPVQKVIAYEVPGQDRIAILVPAEIFLHLIKIGGIVRHMRQIDSTYRGIPVFEGSAKIMPPMSEKEAFEFLAWKDIPRNVNRWSVVERDSLPPRKDRDRWRLNQHGRVVLAGGSHGNALTKTD
jgi:hypothetical protein